MSQIAPAVHIGGVGDDPLHNFIKSRCNALFAERQKMDVKLLQRPKFRAAMQVRCTYEGCERFVSKTRGGK